MKKKILLKILSFVILLIVINYIYKFTFFEKDLQQHSSDSVNLIRAVPNDADIIYIGESSNITSRGDDNDKRSISAFVGDYFPELNIYDISLPASHAGIFKVLLKNIPKQSEVQTIIVTLNLRSFNAQWIYSKLETPLQKSMVLLKPYPPIINRFLLSFKSYDIQTDEERELQFKQKWEEDVFNFPYPFPHRDVMQWDKWMANKGVLDDSGSYDKSQTELACHYIKTYGFQIDTLSNPRIKDFNDIIKFAEKRGWNLVFNLLAENTEKAEYLVGKDITYLMNENSKLLKSYYQSKGIKVIDNLNSVEDEQFIDQNWTTEHYAEKGRKIISRNVAVAIKSFHPENYVEPVH